jgi:hypothetical protein
MRAKENEMEAGKKAGIAFCDRDIFVDTRHEGHCNDPLPILTEDKNEVLAEIIRDAYVHKTYLVITENMVTKTDIQ